MPETKTAEVKLGDWLDEADPLMARYAIAAARLQRHRARLEKELAVLRSEYEGEITEAEKNVASLSAKLEALAANHKDEFAAACGRSYLHAGVRIGFRETPPRVHIKRGYLEIATVWLRRFCDGRFLRVKEEIAKDLIRDELMQPGMGPRIDDFRERGITLKSDDRFFVEVEKADKPE